MGSLGLYTQSSPLSNSTVDYSITDLESLTVSPLTPLSDHSKITLYIRKTPTDYQKTIGHPTIQSQLDHFITISYPHRNDHLNQAVWDINSVFDNTAFLSNLKIPQYHSSNLAHEKWFDSDCKCLRKTQLSNEKQWQPDNPELRLQNWETLKLYRKTLRPKKEQHEQHQLKEI